MVAGVEDAEDALDIEEAPIIAGVVVEEEVDAAHPTDTRQEKDQPRNAKTTVRSSPSDSSKSV